MKNKLVITRKKELNNRLKPYKIYINDDLVDEIYNNEERKVLFFNEDEIEIFFKIDWCYSKRKKIYFGNKDSMDIEVRSSISDALWFFVVAGISLMVVLYFLFDNKYFTYYSLLFLLIPLLKISFGKNNYLIIDVDE